MMRTVGLSLGLVQFACINALVPVCPPSLGRICSFPKHEPRMGGLSRSQKKSVDAALDRLNRRPPLASHRDAEVVSDAHAVLAVERRIAIQWDSLPFWLDPHSTTWRGSSIKVGSGVDTTSHETIKSTVNRRSARKRTQVG